jgi:hypothetical protein
VLGNSTVLAALAPPLPLLAVTGCCSCQPSPQLPAVTVTTVTACHGVLVTASPCHHSSPDDNGCRSAPVDHRSYPLRFDAAEVLHGHTVLALMVLDGDCIEDQHPNNMESPDDRDRLLAKAMICHLRCSIKSAVLQRFTRTSAAGAGRFCCDSALGTASCSCCCAAAAQNPFEHRPIERHKRNY